MLSYSAHRGVRPTLALQAGMWLLTGAGRLLLRIKKEGWEGEGAGEYGGGASDHELPVPGSGEFALLL